MGKCSEKEWKKEGGKKGKEQSVQKEQKNSNLLSLLIHVAAF